MMSTDFYRALADVRKVTLQATSERQLYTEVCRIAVEAGHALMAWVGLIEGGNIVPVACAGPASDYTNGLVIKLPAADDDSEPLGPTAFAVKHGLPYVCNDFQVEACTEPWRSRAARFGVGASLAYPLSRGGRTIGALNLYFRTAGACKPALVELVHLMASDLAYALDHLDEQRARLLAEAAAQEHETRLARIIDATLEAIIVVDARFRIVVFNRAASAMFGVSAEDAIGHPLDRFIPMPSRDAHRDHVANFAATGHTSRHMGTRYVEALRADGSTFPIEASISRVGEGPRLLLTAMVRDVSALRDAERAQLARTAAEAANRAKTQFLSRMSHELRTPLNAMMGFAQLMSLDSAEAATPRQLERLGHVLTAGQHLCTLIDEALDVARIESGRMPMDFEEVELEPQLDTVLSMCAPQADDAGVRIEAVYKPLLGLTLRTDPARLRQVLLNLLSNALKYNRRGGWCRVQVESDDERVRIGVSDGGLGMTPEQMGGLFDPFNRLGRECSDVPGTGLGLVLVKELVELMGGDLALQSQAGVGTAVLVSLPRD